MSNRRQPLRIGLAGAGMVSTHHLAAWSRIPNARVAAIADPDIAKATNQARRFGVEAAYASVPELIQAGTLDALDIAAPVALHGELCRLAADHGLAILCQKPLAETLSEAEQIVSDVSDRVRMMVHENWRFRLTYRKIGEWLEAGAIGDVECVSMSATSSGLIAGPDGAFPALTRQPFLATMDRLLVFEVLIHHIDVLRWLFGDLAVCSRRLSRASNAVSGEDNATVEFSSPSVPNIKLRGSLTEATAPVRIRDTLEITGTAGSIRLQDTELSVEGRKSEQLVWDVEQIYASAFHGALQEFVEGLRVPRPFESEATDNLDTLRIVESIYQPSSPV